MRKLWKEYEEGGAALFGHAMKLTGDVDEAHDIVQEAIVRAARSWDTFDEREPVGPWLHTIMRRVWLDDRKRAASRLNISLEALVGKRYPDKPIRLRDVLEDPEDGPERAVERQDVAGRVCEALGRVSEDHRDVLRLVDMDGASYDAAAAMLRLPVGTVRSRLARARKAMRRVLAPALA